MIIDPHVHVWSDAGDYPFEPSLSHNIPGSVELLNQTMAKTGVDKAVVVQPIQYLYDNRYVAGCLRRFPGRFAGVALVDSKDMGAPEKLEELVNQDGFGGIRLHFSRQKDPTVLAQEDQYPLWQQVQRLDAAVTILVKGCGQLPVVERMIQRFQEVKVVIDHMGFLDSAEKPPYPSFSNLTRLASYPNVSIKVSNLALCSHEPYPHRDVFPFVRILHDSFGPERLMWASDWPLITVREAGGYKSALELIRSHMDFLNQNDKDWLLNKSITRIWRFS